MPENESMNKITNVFNIESVVNVDNALTAKEIFEKVVDLQKQLTENSYNSLHRLADSISSVYENESDEKHEQIIEICNVFMMRETTFQKMLEFYEKMYNDL